jgi:insulysin
MVFLGSEKYPNPDDFSQHLALYNGYHNAYTASGETVYYNEVGYEGMEKGMDVFAQFFIAPTLDEAMVNKEIHAVDSEHKKNMPDTKWQIYHLVEDIANPKNPMSKFSTGNLETLKTKPEANGKSLVTALKTFHKEHYCSQKLHLVIVANMSTDDQLNLAHKYFDAIPKTDEKSCKPRRTYYDTPAYTKDQGNLGRQYTVATHGSPQMWVFFPTTPLKDHYRAVPEAYISNAAGHWGPGSLKALLTELDLVQSYGFHADSSVAGSKLMFTFSLTPKGLEDPNLVLEKFFAYFNQLKGDIDPKVMASMKGLRQIDFDYQEKQSSENAFVSQLAGSTPNYAPEDILAGGYLIMDEDEALVKKVLASITPDNMNVVLVSSTFEESKGNKHEKYYDFKYLDEPIPADSIARFSSAKDAKLKPPPALEYVPTKTELIQEGAGSQPKKVLNAGRLQMWWMGMNDVKLPKTSINIKVGYPAALTRRVDGNVLASMHSRLVYHILEEPTDDMLMCGISYSVAAHTDGLAISFGGFDQHIEALIAAVLPTVRNPQFKEEDFEMVRRDLIQGLSDITKTQPYGHAQQAMEVVTVKGAFSRQELLAMSKDTKKVSVETYKKFLGEVFDNDDTHMTLLFAGNVDEARAEKITNLVEEKLKMENLRSAKKEELEVTRLAVLKPKEEVEVLVENPIPDDPNHATIAAYQFGVPTIADRAHLSLLSGIIERPVFETLRTKHQLGYVVFGYATLHQNIAEVQVLVQGFRENPDSVDLLIEGTLANITKHIETIKPEEIETRKQSMITAYKQKPTKISEE